MPFRNKSSSESVAMYKSKVFVLVALAFVCARAGIPDKSQPNYSNEPCDSETEQYSECANAHCGIQQCARRTLGIVCPSVPACFKGCLCKFQYLRDVNGTCVPEDKCSIGPQCGENEEYTPCKQKLCRPYYCGDATSPCNPEDVKDDDCSADCVCKENYARSTTTGFCVPLSEC